MQQFWATWWIPVLIVDLLLVMLWGVVALIAATFASSEKSFEPTRRERRLARLPRSMTLLAKRPIPRPNTGGEDWRRFESRHVENLATVDTAFRSLFFAPFLLADAVALVGAIQVLWTFFALQSSVTSWHAASVAALTFSLVPFLATAGLFDRARARRFPFEWRFLEGALWSIHHLQRSTGAANGARTLQHLQDVERILVERFRSSAMNNLPSNAIAGRNWFITLSDAVDKKSELMFRQAETGLHMAAISWIEEVSLLVEEKPGCAPLTKKQLRRMSEARAIANSRPKNPFSVTSILVVVVISCGLLVLSFAMQRMREINIQPDIPAIWNVLVSAVGVLSAIATIVGVIVSVKRHDNRRTLLSLFER